MRKSIVILALVAATMGTLWPMPPLFSFERHPSHRGCHEQSSQTPASRYDCCLSGHNVAIPSAFPPLRPAIHFLANLAPAPSVDKGPLSGDRPSLRQLQSSLLLTPLRV